MHTLLRLSFALLALTSFTAANKSDPPPVPSGIAICQLARRGTPATAVSPHPQINGLQLSKATTQASLSSSGINGGFDYGGGLGAFFGCHDFWLNVVPSGTTYKALDWQFDNKVTNNWSNAGGYLSVGGNPNFLACLEQGIWFVYLETGSQDPPRETCYPTKLKAGT